MSYSTRIRLILLAALTLLTTQNVFAAFPSASGGGSFCFFGCNPISSGGSHIIFDFNPDNDAGLAPVAINFFPYPDSEDIGDLCWSGKVKATINGYDGTPSSGTAVYDLLSSDLENKGMCYSNVTRIEKTDSDGILSGGLGDCTYKTYIYSLVLPNSDTNVNLANVLNGKFKVDTSLATEGAYDICDTAPTTNICDIEVGFGVYNTVPAFDGFHDLFPADTSLSGEDLVAGQVVFADEVRIECPLEVVGLDPSAALSAKSSTIDLGETLAMTAHWCTDLQSENPDCNAFNDEGDRTVGSVRTAIGDFQTQNVDITCVSSSADLLTLAECSTEVALAACADGTGLIEMSENFTVNTDETGVIVDETCAYNLSFTSPLGGGYDDVNVIAFGAYYSPGYAGDSQVPAVSEGNAAIVDDPDVNNNNWDFSAVGSMTNIVFIFGREGDDIITGWSGFDNILGDNGVDTLHGGPGNDILQGGANGDYLYGDEGNDLLLGYQCTGLDALPANGSCNNKGSDSDDLYGGAGDDCLDGGRGSDMIDPGAGNDVIVLNGAFGGDVIENFDGEFDVIVSSAALTVEDNGDGTYTVAAKGKNAVTVWVAPGGTAPTDLGDDQNVFDSSALSGFSQCALHPAY